MRVVAIGLAAALSALAVRADGQPAPAPDYARAKQLYDAASSELDKGAFVDAVRDFGAAYEITKDPVVFYKIALANEKAGKCEVALVYYGRYLHEAKPAQHFVELTRERVAACGGDWKSIADAGVAPAGSAAGSDSGSGSGSDAGSATGSGSDVVVSGSGSDAGSGSDVVLTGMGSGSAAVIHHGNDLPWLMVGGALAFVTAGAVLAYSASSSEQDIKDLYVGLNNQAPTFDMKTQQRYQELLDEGHRYQYLSWGAFGVAAGFGIAATLLFVHDHNVEQQRLIVTPAATPQSASVTATYRF